LVIYETNLKSPDVLSLNLVVQKTIALGAKRAEIITKSPNPGLGHWRDLLYLKIDIIFVSFIALYLC